MTAYFSLLAGSILWATGIFKSLALNGNTDNWALVNGYSQVSMTGLWIMGFSFIWILLRKK